ncbi:MAG TPA: c-type cytochrome [Solirubrobacterales bacterium]|nr:c-type cytochrome [Solirubrobacterales bacterium]
MSKKTFVSFALLVLFLAVLIPWLVFRADGDSAPEAHVPSELEDAKALFDVNCGNCHALYAAETDGNFGPDLDELLAPAGPAEGKTAATTIKTNKSRVLTAIENGVDSTTEPGRMPAGILNGEQAEEVAEFVARTAGQG